MYELILGQTLSAFLGNTVLRYSVTIGLYMLAMGFGAMFAEGKFVEKSKENFMKIELALTILGGLVVVIFFYLSYWIDATILFSIVAHSLIVVIGVLTGFEIPLLIEMTKDPSSKAEVKILGIDYIGAFVASIVFAFLFYPKLGLVSAAFITGILNALAGLLVFYKMKAKNDRRKIMRKLALFQGSLALILLILLLNSQLINNYLIEGYLNR
jgi:spermidine synthase